MRFRSKIKNFSNPVLWLCLIFIAWSKMLNDLYQKTIYWNLKVNKVLLTHVQRVWERSTAQTDPAVLSEGPGDGWLKYTQCQQVFNQQCDTVRNPLSSIFGANSANLIPPRMMSETQQWSLFFFPSTDRDDNTKLHRKMMSWTLMFYWFRSFSVYKEESKTVSP